MPGNDIKLTYFNLAGRAELSRLILAYAGAKYEDCRITGEQWKELKPKTSCGQLPTLCWNGVEIAQSMTIARFLAKEFHIAGKCTLEQAKADMVVDCVSDLFAAMLKHFFEKDEKLKAEYKKKFDEETLPNGMAVLEKLLCANGGKYFAGDSLTWADICVAQWCCNRDAACMAKCPKLKAQMECINNIPSIKKWIETRPKTQG